MQFLKRPELLPLLLKTTSSEVFEAPLYLVFSVLNEDICIKTEVKEFTGFASSKISSNPPIGVIMWQDSQ